MATDKKMVAGAGILSMLKGMQFEVRRDSDDEAELARQEGLDRMRARVRNDNASSGWVNKNTGEPIRQNQLDSVPPEERSTKADYALEVGKKGYDAKLLWEAAEKKRLEGLDIEQDRLDNQARLEKARIDQKGKMARKQLDITVSEAKTLKDEAKEAVKTAKGIKDWNFKVQKERDKYREEFQSYVDENAAFESKLPFGIGDEEAKPTMQFDQWFETNYPSASETYAFEGPGGKKPKQGEGDDRGKEMLAGIMSKLGTSDVTSKPSVEPIPESKDELPNDIPVQDVGSQGLLNVDPATVDTKTPDIEEEKIAPTTGGMYQGMTTDPREKIGTGGKEFSLNESIPQMMARWKEENSTIEDVKRDIIASMTPEERKAFSALSEIEQDKKIRELLQGAA